MPYMTHSFNLRVLEELGGHGAQPPTKKIHKKEQTNGQLATTVTI